MAAVGNWWELPLPPGWERKFDPGSNRYFYLNHSNRQTQWEDPRIQLFAQLQANRGQQPQQQHYGQAAHHAQHQPTHQQQYAQQHAAQQHPQQLQPQHQQYGVQQRSPQPQRATTPQHQSTQQHQHNTQHLQQHTSQQQHSHQHQHHTPKHQQQQPSGQGQHSSSGASHHGQVSPQPRYDMVYQQQQVSPQPRYDMVYQQQQVAARQPSPVRQPSPARQPSPTRQPSPARSPYLSQPTHQYYHDYHNQNHGLDHEYDRQLQVETATQRARTPERTAAHPKPASHLQTGGRAAQSQRSPHLQPTGTAQSYGLSQNQYDRNQTWSKGNYAHPKPALTRPHVITSGSIQMQEELSQNETEESSDDETSFITTDPFEFNKLHGMFPTAPEGLIKKVLAKNHNDHNRSVHELQQCGYQTSQGAQATNTAQKVAIIKRLKQSFPQADQEMLDDVLTQCGGDEQKARRQLSSLGYTSRGAAEPKRTVSPARPAHREPSPPRISEADKQRLFSKFEHDFKSHPKSIIQMALDASNYDETKTRILLQSMESPKDRTRTTATSRSELSPSRATVSAESSRQEPASVSGVVVTVTTPDSISRPGTASSTISSSIGGSRPSSSQARPSSADRRPSPSKQAKRQQQPKPRKEQRQPAKQTQPQQPKSKRQRETTRTETRPARAQRMPERPAYVSPLRTKPNGPDASLVQGPSKDNLLTDYVQEHGHQSDLAKGPDKSNLIKYTGLSSEGPQASNRQGPNPDLVQGPMHLNRAD